MTKANIMPVTKRGFSVHGPNQGKDADRTACAFMSKVAFDLPCGKEMPIMLKSLMITAEEMMRV
jgi:hypothetical protein